MKKELAESVFLRYAFPCAFIIRERKAIDEKTFLSLESSAKNDIPVSRELLQKVFFKAFFRIAILAKKDRSDIWDIRVIRKYFQKEHNEYIENGYDSYKNAPPSLKNLCRVEQATISNIFPQALLVTFKNGKTRVVHSLFVPAPKLHEKVWVHYGYAVERVEEEVALR